MISMSNAPAMSVQTELRPLYGQNSAVFSQAIELLRKTYQNKVSAFFIYQSPAYLNHLKSINQSRHHGYSYTLHSSQGGNLIGLAMLRVRAKTLFLNQIILKAEFQGKGLGSRFLDEVISDIIGLSSPDEFSHFELETFYSNIRARGIYEYMGMRQGKGKYWYHANHSMLLSRAHLALDGVALWVDLNGFSQIYLNADHMGTLIDHEHARINTADISLAKSLSSYLYHHHHIGRICIVSSKPMPLLLLDFSLPYTISMENILRKINL